MSRFIVKIIAVIEPMTHVGRNFLISFVSSFMNYDISGVSKNKNACHVWFFVGEHMEEF